MRYFYGSFEKPMDNMRKQSQGEGEEILKTFLRKKGVSLSIREYLITALSYMALGLFSSLIIGLIIQTIGEQLGIVSFMEMGSFAMDTKIMGGAIGVGWGWGLKCTE